MPKFIDLTGKKFGKWTVLELGEHTYTPKGQKRTMWTCRCECGRVKDVCSGSLTSGHSKGCGACTSYIKEHNPPPKKEKKKRKNRKEECGDYTILYTSKDEVIYIDTEDYARIENFYWHIKPDSGYVATSIKYRIDGKIKQKNILLHRFIMGEPDALVDHIHDDRKWDNRKNNLRVATKSENAINSPPRKKNISGCTGVTKTRSGTWRARIQVDGKEKMLGTFKNIDDAIKARKDAEKIYYGEFAYDYSQELYRERFENCKSETDDGEVQSA